ncbi:Ldh family oxidoreductase [Pseudooceanicola aestuarii]|uniref:Ldh family oxidoreductase n=1 Tax=Pseudooceanicola aestuarii TaxID=2697319 RepID=UPI0013CFBA4A|nr:Ldh family oxidoreductase [Pseudooceanicola aestuarii]
MIAARDAVDQLARAMGDSPSAALAAAALVEADALGQPRFGIDMLAEWSGPAGALPEGLTPPRALSWVDCTGTCAPLAVAGATLATACAARDFGLAAMFLRGVRGFGRLAPFVRQLADDGLVGLMGAEGPPFVTPHGGTAPVIGTNPLALAMGADADRVVIDLGTGTTTMAALRGARAEGHALPADIALDDQGRPTCDAAAAAAVLPRGGQVGSLLGLMVELLAGVAGAGRGDPGGRGVFVLAVTPDRAGTDPEWQARLAGLRQDWTQGGGHWPRGGGLPPDTRLDADFERRLEGCLARLARPDMGD